MNPTPKSAWRRFLDSHFFYSFKRDPVAVASFITLVLLVLAGFLAPLIAPHNPYDAASIDILDAELPPAWKQGGSTKFLLGTDSQGRDILSTMFYGLRTSLIIGLGAVLLQTVLGVGCGLVAGYAGGRVEAFLMRLADVQLSFSTMLVAIFMGAAFQAFFGVASWERLAVPLLVLVIGIAEWPMYARTVRAQVLGEKKKEYVEAARVIGLPARRILLRHVLPNTLSPVLVIATVQVAKAIMSEAALSFLGFGMPITRPSLGSLIKSGFKYIFSGSWWITLYPGLMLVLLVLAINLLGDFVRDAMNPKLYKE